MSTRSTRLNKVCMAVVAMIAVVFLGSVLAGCGGGGPSDADIKQAVVTALQDNGIRDSSIRLPQGRVLANLQLGQKEKITVTDFKVVKRGKPFTSGMGATGVVPVRVFVRGTTLRRHGARSDDVLVLKNIKETDLPFEYEGDFVTSFRPPDKTKVDAKPGEWVADPNP